MPAAPGAVRSFRGAPARTGRVDGPGRDWRLVRTAGGRFAARLPLGGVVGVEIGARRAALGEIRRVGVAIVSRFGAALRLLWSRRGGGRFVARHLRQDREAE